MMRARTLLAAATLCALAPLPAAAQQSPTSSAPRAEVLVLGTYHMANPGHDLVNMHADDVLAAKRQTEMTELIAVLKKFQPTKIAVERDPGDSRMAKDYADYLAGTHALTQNEIEQIGFRLAKELGQKSIYGVDADGEFPYPRLEKYAKATGRAPELEAMMGEVTTMVKEQGDYLGSHSVLQALLYMNADDKAAYDMGLYFRQAHLGEPWDWAGGDLIADWYRRNIRIFSNVMGLANAPTERVLVIFGAGHLGWLQQDFSNDPTVRLRKLAEFAK